MTKAFDRASDLEMEEREQALNRHLNRVKELPDELGICNDCGAAIPAARISGTAACCDLYQLSGHQRTQGEACRGK